MQCPCGSFWGGNPKHSSFSSQRAAPMTHLYWRRGFILFWGKQDLRSQHLLSSLALWVLEARHITAVWLKIYTLSDMFSLIFSKPYLLHFAESCLRWGSGSCLNRIATVSQHQEQRCGFLINVFWWSEMCNKNGYNGAISDIFTCPHIETEKNKSLHFECFIDFQLWIISS